MDILVTLFGRQGDLNSLQMVFRAIVVFFFALLLIRIAGRRSFGIQTSLDNVLTILLGAVLSRSVVGASPFFPTIFACLTIAILHRLFGIICVFSRTFSLFTKGKKIPIYKNGRWMKKNMVRALANQADVMQQVRLSTFEDSLDNVDTLYMETNGHISVMKKHQ